MFWADIRAFIAFQSLFQELPVANVSNVSNEQPQHPCPKRRKNKTKEIRASKPPSIISCKS